jgi:O-antigen ligase
MVGLSGALAIAYVPEQLVQRFATTGTEVEDARFGGRFKLWVAGVNAFAQRPLMGYGVATYKLAITPQLGSAAQVAHDSFLSVLVEEGLVGLLLYLLMLLSVYLAILRLPRFPRRFALVLFATLVTAMLPLTWEDEKEVWLVSAMLFGMSSVVGAGLSGATSPDASRTAPIGRRPPAALSTERLATSGRIRNRDGTA